MTHSFWGYSGLCHLAVGTPGLQICTTTYVGMWLLKIQTQALRLVWQTLHLPSSVSRPLFLEGGEEECFTNITLNFVKPLHTLDAHRSITAFSGDKEKWKLGRAQRLKVKLVLVETCHTGMSSIGIAHVFILCQVVWRAQQQRVLLAEGDRKGKHTGVTL